MEITSYSDIEMDAMPVVVYTARAKFENKTIDNEIYTVDGSYDKVEIIGDSYHYLVGEGFMTNTNNLYIYHGKNPNKIFTTKKEAIEWSEKDLGFIL